MRFDKINSYINPFSKNYISTSKFEDLNKKQKIITVSLSVLTSVSTCFVGGLGGTLTFTVLVKHFNSENSSVNNEEKQRIIRIASIAEVNNIRVNKNVTNPINKINEENETYHSIIERLSENLDDQSQAFIPLVIESVAIEKRKDISYILESLLNKLTNEEEKKRFFNFLYGISLKNTVKFISYSDDILQKEANIKTKNAIFSYIEDILSLGKENSFEICIPLFKELNFSSIIIMLDIFKDDPPNQNMIHTFQSLLTGTNEEDKVEILKEIQKIHYGDRYSVVQASEPLLKGLITKEKIKLLDAISNISALERENVIQVCQPLLNELNVQEMPLIFQAITNIPVLERERVIQVCQSLLKKLGAYDVSLILQAIINVPLLERENIIQFISKPLIANEDIIGITQILKAVANIPENNRAFVIESVLPLSAQLKKGEKQVVLQLMNYFPVDKIVEVIESMKKLAEFSKKDKIIFAILSDNESLRDSVYTHLINQLQSTNAQIVSDLSSFILNNRRVFFIPYDDIDHPLIQEAINKEILTKQIQHPKNPYLIYNKLKTELSQPSLSINLSNQIVDNTLLKWNINELKELAIKKEAITFGKLPKEVQSNTILNIFDSLEQRLEKSPVRQTLENYIQELTGQSFTVLYNNFTKDEFLKNLLSKKGEDSQIAPIDVVRFRTIVKYILDQSNERKSGQLLSDQEELLIKFSVSIQNCPTGKAEGIAIAYNLLPVDYRHLDIKADTFAIEKAKNYIYLILQQLLNDVFVNQEMLQEMIGITDIQQVAHQTLFLKNRLGLSVGLEHSLQFDPNTQLLYDSLIEKDLLESLQIFFKYFKPAQLISLLKNGFKKDKSSINQLYGTLTSLLPSHVPISEVWVLDEDETEIEGLTERGAKELLIAAKLIESVE